jgi:siroheme synthase
MGMGRRAEIVQELLAAGRPIDEPVAVVRWGTTADQEVVRTTLAGLPDVGLAAPATIVIGPVAALDVTGVVKVDGRVADGPD